jgi:hypothetical protein
VPVVVIHASEASEGSARSQYADWEQKEMPLIVKDLSHLTKGKTTYMEVQRFNHNNIYRSQMVKQAISQMVRDEAQRQQKQATVVASTSQKK